MPHRLIRFTCSCGKRLAAPVKAAGREAKCPRCQGKIVVPKIKAASAASSSAKRRTSAATKASPAKTRTKAAKSAKATKSPPAVKSTFTGKPPAPRTQAPAAAKLKRCNHPKLDEFYRALLKKLEPLISQHDVTDGVPTVRFLLPEDRRQGIRLRVETDDHQREWLVVESEIGTITTFQEAATALQLNHALGAARLYLDKFQILQLEHRSRLDETEEADVLQIVDHVARWADDFEVELFGIDVR